MKNPKIPVNIKTLPNKLFFDWEIPITFPVKLGERKNKPVRKDKINFIIAVNY